jgi:hypothetical protein
MRVAPINPRWTFRSRIYNACRDSQPASRKSQSEVSPHAEKGPQLMPDAKQRQKEVFPRRVRREVVEADATTRWLPKIRHKAKGGQHGAGDAVSATDRHLQRYP